MKQRKTLSVTNATTTRRTPKRRSPGATGKRSDAISFGLRRDSRTLTPRERQEPGPTDGGILEPFETFDDAGRPIGLAPRDIVHATGLWHRSVHVFLFRPDGALYLQERAQTKDVFPGCWDLSVGEHLQPGESYLEGALRGLQEELGVTGVQLAPLGGERRFCNELPALGIIDREFQAAFRGTHAGALRPERSEVRAIRAVSAKDLATWISQEPTAFTPWLLNELRVRPGLGEFGYAASDR